MEKMCPHNMRLGKVIFKGSIWSMENVSGTKMEDAPPPTPKPVHSSNIFISVV